MAYARKKKTFKRRPRKTYKKRKSYIGSTITNFSKPMPPQIKCILKYVGEAKSLTSSTIAVGTTYSLTNLFDVDFSGVGLQPLGYDQMSVFYSRYRVNSVRYTVRFHSPDVDGMKVLVLVRRQAATYGPATIERISEISRGKMKMIATDTPISNGTFRGTIYPASVHGITAEKYRVDDMYDSPILGSPARNVHLDVMCQYKDNSAAHNVYFTIECLFNCTFHGLKILPIS